MNALRRFEQRLEQLVSGVFAKAFRSAVQPVEIAAALQRECDNNAQILSRQRRLVPNSFHVDLSLVDMERLTPYDSALAGELTRQVQEHADLQGYVFPGPLSVTFEESRDLTTGRFRVTSKPVAQVTGHADPADVRRAEAFLEINGSRHPLHPPGLVLGRGSEADVRINDPGVSRRHVEFRVVSSGWSAGHEDLRVEVRDLGSTNGVLVDGQPHTSAPCEDGTQVKIGTTTMTVHLHEARHGTDRRGGTGV